MRSRKRVNLLFVLLVAGLPLIVLATPAKGAETTTREFVITARQWAYDPPVIEVNQGDEVVIILRSADISHGIYIEGYNIRADLILEEGLPTEVELRFTADKPGTFVFRCTVNCGPFHPFMTGILKVNPNHTFQISSLLAVLLGLLTSAYLILFRR